MAKDKDEFAFTPPKEKLTTVSKVRSRWDREQAKRESAFLLSSERLFDKLRELKIKKVFVGFNGYGDDGSFGPFKVRMNAKRAAVPKLREIPFEKWSMYDEIERVASEQLSISHSGWVIEYGSFGKIILDVPLRVVREQFTWNLDYDDQDDENEAVEVEADL
jgi:hypothetical protein